MSHTNLSAAEIALLDPQLPDIGGAIRGKPVTPDGGRLAGGQVVLCLNPQRVWPASLRVATGAPALVAVAARSARRPARAPIPAAAGGTRSFQHCYPAAPRDGDGDGSRCRRPPQSST